MDRVVGDFGTIGVNRVRASFAALPSSLTRAQVCLFALLTAAVLFGGGGSPAPLAETVVIIASLAIAAVMLIDGEWDVARIGYRNWMIALALPAIALAQIIPIPFEIRRHLPFGGQLEVVTHAAGSIPDVWPLSIDPASTIWSGLCLLPPVIAFLLTVNLKPAERRQIPVLIAALAMISATAAIMQAATGGLELYDRPAGGGAAGLFANQNSQADLLLIGMCGLLAMPVAHRFGAEAASARIAGGWAVLMLALFLTGSRMGLVLLAIPIAFLAFCTWREAGPVRRHRLWLIVPVSMIFATALAFDFGPFARADLASDGRIYAIWPDAVRLAFASFPWGTGTGTFEHAFPMVERLSVVDPSHANRAHSDWLEFAVEAGVFAILVTVCLAVRVGASLTAKFRSGFDRTTLFPVAVLATVGLHALVDYPFRSISLAVVSAIALGLVLSAERGVANDQ